MIWGRCGQCNGRACCDLREKSSGLDLQSREEAQKYIKISGSGFLGRVCFNVRQMRAGVLHAEPAVGPCFGFTQRHKDWTQALRRILCASGLSFVALCETIFAGESR